VITRRVARLERFFLTPLVFVLPALALFYLFQRAWLIGVFWLLIWGAKDQPLDGETPDRAIA
jgi:hypothetical protein